MIFFKTLRWKNFLSTGNTWTEVDLLSSKTTLIIGQNGSGKSTMLDALAFGLFGRPHRNINKPQLVNTVNNRDCLVEVSFQIGKAEFKIVRGIKPTVFEIWKDGTMINQSSHSREYQQILEQNILKLNHKSFHQIVVLGSSSFIPFMQLPAHHRREVIEDLLDINVFSKMNSILKERLTTLRDVIKENDYQLEITKDKIKNQEKFLRELKALNENAKKEKQDEIQTISTEIESLQSENAEHSSWLEGNQQTLEEEFAKTQEKKQQLATFKSTFEQQIRAVVKDAKFYETNDTCPTCTQSIDTDFKDQKLRASQDRAKELQKAMDHATQESANLEQALKRVNDATEELRRRSSDIHANNSQITRLQRRIRDISSELDIAKTSDGDEEELHKLTAIKDALMEQKLKMSEEQTYNIAMSEMLKDTGIKTKVIKQYLPVINKLSNNYLQILDFFVHFDLDESFNETIRSRHRDSFSYDSFSEGEKQRIDLALLFCWRMIAKMKNSVATNLLILDETFDSSLDHEGVDNLMKILDTLEDDTNTFVISHKGEILEGKFARKIEFKKEKNFSKVAA